MTLAKSLEDRSFANFAFLSNSATQANDIVLYANNTQNQNNKIRAMEAQGSTIHTQNFRKRNKKRERNRNREKEVAERENTERESTSIIFIPPLTHAPTFIFF